MSNKMSEVPVPPSPYYTNPVFSSAFPDPFVLKHLGEYWGYCSGAWHDGRWLGIAHSHDLVHWEAREGALEPLPGNYSEYWAPEVAFDGHTFYLYYSVGDEVQMHIRVATSSTPSGPFQDAGLRLTAEEFAIDPHIFVDDDGTWYLFYATDYLTHSRIGTGTAMVRLLDPMTTEGSPRPAVRAAFDWQIYDPARKEKGGVRWHTAEGPFVLKHKGRYYEMFSGGNWHNLSYGVGYAIADDINQPGEWQQYVDGQAQLPILHTIPGKVMGPGHNSVVRGPDNVQQFCVYHRWVNDERVVAIDRLEWIGERMVVLGPTTDEQPRPNGPLVDSFESPLWRTDAAEWRLTSQEAEVPLQSRAQSIAFDLPVSSGTLELTYSNQAGDPEGSGVHCRLFGWGGLLGSMEVAPTSVATASNVHATSRETLVRIDIDSRLVRLSVDGRPAGDVSFGAPVESILFSCRAGTRLLAPAFTPGWADEFVNGVRAEEWSVTGHGSMHGEPNVMLLRAQPAETVTAVRGPALDRYEVVVNLRPQFPATAGAEFGVLIGERPGAEGCVFRRGGDGWAAIVGDEVVSLPGIWKDAGPSEFQQVRLRSDGDRIQVSFDMKILGNVLGTLGPTRPLLMANNVSVVFDMVRVTALSD